MTGTSGLHLDHAARSTGPPLFFPDTKRPKQTAPSQPSINSTPLASPDLPLPILIGRVGQGRRLPTLRHAPLTIFCHTITEHWHLRAWPPKGKHGLRVLLLCAQDAGSGVHEWART